MAKRIVKEQKTFTIGVNITLDTDVEVRADSLEGALEIARTLEVQDVVEFSGGYNDGSIHINMVFGS